jgi:hypothetical protein
MGQTPPHWFVAALSAVRGLHASLGAPLVFRIDRFFERFSRMNGGLPLEASLFTPSATPFVRLIEAYREDVGIAPGDPRLYAVGEGTLLLYFYLRMQDDLIDEPALADRGDVYAMEALSAASTRAFASAVAGDAAFFAWRDVVMRGFASAAAWEIDVAWRGGASSPPEDAGGGPSWIGRKFLPMALPFGALAFIAGRGSDAEGLAAITVGLGCGLQIMNDVLNIGDDHAARRVSPLLRRLYEGGRASPSDPAGQVRAILLADGSLDEAMDRARSAIEEAAEAASSMGAGALASVIRERVGYVETVPARLLALCLGGGPR